MFNSLVACGDAFAKPDPELDPPDHEHIKLYDCAFAVVKGVKIEMTEAVAFSKNCLLFD